MSFNIGKKSRVVTYDVQCTVEDEDCVVYTCPANARAMMSLLFVANVTGNTTVDIQWFRDNGTRHNHILGGKNMTAGEYILLTGATLVLEPGDKIQVMPTGNATPNIDAMCTVTETFIPVG